MQLYAKSAFKKKDMDVKVDIGCDGIEIQLLGELVNGELGKYFKAQEVFELEKFHEYPISVVHCPLLGKFGLPDVNIENFATNDFELLNQVCYIANYFGKLQEKNVIVVIHSEMSMENMHLVGILVKLEMIIQHLLFQYPYIEIAIENVSPLRKVYKSEIHLCNNFSFDNVELVAYLRQKLATDRIGTCLDTCHAMITDRYMKAIYEQLEDIPYTDYSLEKYFLKNKNYIKLIHLSDMKGNGYGRGKHGISFFPETKDRLEYILALYGKYGYQCPVTLEVEETDYLVCESYRKTRELVLDILD